ncbi:hypothetical protein D3C83_158420 [compost metagenome]
MSKTAFGFGVWPDSGAIQAMGTMASESKTSKVPTPGTSQKGDMVPVVSAALLKLMRIGLPPESPVKVIVKPVMPAAAAS